MRSYANASNSSCLLAFIPWIARSGAPVLAAALAWIPPYASWRSKDVTAQIQMLQVRPTGLIGARF
jgi:hypothetical protein